MHRINLLLGGPGAEVQALLDLHAARNVVEFWTNARRVAGSALPFDSCWFEPSSSLQPSCAAFAHDRCFASDAEFRRFCDAHPARSFLRAHPARLLARLSDLAPEAEFHREFMAPHEDGYAVVLGIGNGRCESFVGLHRRDRKRDFSPEEMRLLGELQRQLGVAWQRVRVLERERQERQSRASLFAHLALPTVVLDWELEVLHCNPVAMELAAIWTADDESARFLRNIAGFVLPPDISEHCRSVKAHWEPPGRCVPAPRMHDTTTLRRAGLPGMRVSVRVMRHDAASPGSPVFAVTFEDLRQPARCDDSEHTMGLPEMARLTLREREVAVLICQGNSDKEIAVRLGKSVPTVKKQIGSIYQKLEVPGRGKLAVLLRH